jgi:uncharacterized protein (DUF3084 family)
MMLSLLGQSIENPPMEGVNGWFVGVALTAVFSIAANIWSEYQRRAERRDKKAEQQTVAAISAEQDRTRLEFESVKNIIDDFKEYNQRLSTQVEKLLLAVSERDEAIRKRDESTAALHQEINSLKSEIEKMKFEIKSLERSRDEALALVRDRRSEETSPAS